MPPPSLFHRFRQTLGRALRETGQALDRLGVAGIQHTRTSRVVGDDAYQFQDHLSRHRTTMPLLQRGQPKIATDVAYLAPCATLIGSVTVHKDASVWYKAIVRADECDNGSSFAHHHDENNDTTTTNASSAPFALDPNRLERQPFDGNAVGGGIIIGQGTNVQDGCILTSRLDHCIIGKGVTIGHAAQIHSARVDDYSLIGMGSILEPGVIVESESLIAAGAVVKANTLVESGELWVGNPARKLRTLSAQERQRLHHQSAEYIEVAKTQQHIMELGGNVAQGGPPTLLSEKLGMLEEETVKGVDYYASSGENNDDSTDNVGDTEEEAEEERKIEQRQHQQVG